MAVNQPATNVPPKDQLGRKKSALEQLRCHHAPKTEAHIGASINRTARSEREHTAVSGNNMVNFGSHSEYEWLVTDEELDLPQLCPEIVLEK